MRLTIPTLLIFAGFAALPRCRKSLPCPRGRRRSLSWPRCDRDGNFLVTIPARGACHRARSEFVQKGDVLAEKVKLVVVKRFVTEQITLKVASTRFYDLDGTLVPATQAAGASRMPPWCCCRRMTRSSTQLTEPC